MEKVCWNGWKNILLWTTSMKIGRQGLQSKCNHLKSWFIAVQVRGVCLKPVQTRDLCSCEKGEWAFMSLTITRWNELVVRGWGYEYMQTGIYNGSGPVLVLVQHFSRYTCRHFVLQSGEMKRYRYKLLLQMPLENLRTNFLFTNSTTI